MPARTRLVVPITSNEPPLAQQVAAARAAGADLVELRLDCLRDWAVVEQLLAADPQLPAILTLRSADEGGRWTGTGAERLAVLTRLARQGPAYMDVEYSAWRRSATVRRKIGEVCELHVGSDARRWHAERATGARCGLILSRHDPHRPPRNLSAVCDRLAATPADVVKIVAAARDATDACRMLAELERWRGRRDVVALSLGDAGLATRVLAAKFGGAMTFACLDPRHASAPGQPTIHELRETYRWESIRARTRVYGVVGWPLAHSLGPRVHNAAMAATGVDGVYVPWPVQPGYRALARFLDTVTAHPELGVMGLSVTSPHKENVSRWLRQRGSTVHGDAVACRAVNTLVRCSARGWEGDNTDVQGVRQAFDRLGPGILDGKRVAVLGAGGAARAVIVALRDRARLITVYSRSLHRARHLAREFGCLVKSWEDRQSLDADVLVNATPIGQRPDADATPVPERVLKPGMVVFDAVYQPRATKLLLAAGSRGCRVVYGDAMFIGQAAAQYELWHRIAAPRGAMWAALSDARADSAGSSSS
ncbi:MAG: type I 3-dehydroquinate dehydratase [Planctomycetota bacterium]